jgi:hypothetical protein
MRFVSSVEFLDLIWKGNQPCKLLPYSYNFVINGTNFWKSSYFKVYHLRWENKVKKAHLKMLSLFYK